MKNIVILISGLGSNMQAIAKAARRAESGTSVGGWDGVCIAAVISNRSDAEGLVFARQHGIATEVVEHTSYANREAFDDALAAAIKRCDPQGRPALVVLAGFMRILTPKFVKQFEGRLLNIHPSLLPAFPGLNTHQRAIDAGCKVAGATVHLVTTELDHGPVLAQVVVPILPTDSAATLSARVLSQEHIIYPKTILELLQKI